MRMQFLGIFWERVQAAQETPKTPKTRPKPHLKNPFSNFLSNHFGPFFAEKGLNFSIFYQENKLKGNNSELK